MSNYRLCISLPADDGLKSSIERALEQGVEMIEVRFDYTNKDMLSSMLDIVMDYRDRMIFTCRRRDEGGMYEGSEYERVSMIKRLASFRPMLLDVEYTTLLENEELYDQLRALNADLLISYHIMKDTPSTKAMLDIILKMSKYSSNVKMVSMANSLDDNAKILALYEHPSVKGKVKLVAFCMGEHGIISRVLCTLLGAPFTYSALEYALAPGQLTLREMKEIYKQLDKASIDIKDYAKILRLIESAKGAR